MKRKLNKKAYIAIAALVLIFGFVYVQAGAGSSAGRSDSSWQSVSEDDSEISSEMDLVKETDEYIYVHVCGNVKKPGVYALINGSRVYEALDMAGGALDDSVLDSINLAQIISDGQKILVPSEADIEAEPGYLSDAQDDLVNINTASSGELMTLPGIGNARAAAIISYREQSGGFKDITDIMKVSGIKDAAFSKIKDLIKV